MHKAVIISQSDTLGERIHEVEHEDYPTFFAMVVGSIQGITAFSGTVVSSLTTSQEN